MPKDDKTREEREGCRHFCFCSLEIELCIRGNRNIAKGESVHARITRTYIGRSSIGGIEGLTV